MTLYSPIVAFLKKADVLGHMKKVGRDICQDYQHESVLCNLHVQDLPWTLFVPSVVPFRGISFADAITSNDKI